MDTEQIYGEFEIKNKLGLHARPAALFVQTSGKFSSEIVVWKNEMESADGKSLLSLLMLAIPFGTKIRVSATGPDAASALSAIKQLIDRKFDEE